METENRQQNISVLSGEEAEYLQTWLVVVGNQDSKSGYLRERIDERFTGGLGAEVMAAIRDWTEDHGRQPGPDDLVFWTRIRAARHAYKQRQTAAAEELKRRKNRSK